MLLSQINIRKTFWEETKETNKKFLRETRILICDVSVLVCVLNFNHNKAERKTFLALFLQKISSGKQLNFLKLFLFFVRLFPFRVFESLVLWAQTLIILQIVYLQKKKVR